MSLTVFFNLGSLVLGLTAWGLCAAALRARNPRLCVYGFAACALSLVWQLCEIGHRVGAGDLSAVMDTIRGTVIAAVVLVVVTSLLSFAALRRSRR